MSAWSMFGRQALAGGVILLALGCAPQKPTVPKEVRDELSDLAPQGAKVVSPGGMTYTVQKGDTLTSICRRYGCSRGDLMSANDISDPNRITVGQRLIIPGAQSRSSAPAPASPRSVAEPDMSGVISESNFAWPLRGRILQPYDEDGQGMEHRWITVDGKVGDKVVSSKSGVVAFASESFQGFGKVIIIQHSDSFSTFYGYLSKVLVKPGEDVKQGQVIGEVGQTGRAESPQLLFKIIRGKNPVNPIQYLP